MAMNDLHGAEGVNDLCQRFQRGWGCKGTETAGGFFIELTKLNVSTLPKECPTFLFLSERFMKSGNRAFMYGAGLASCFIGLALITATYMKALDCIVKQTRAVVREDPVTGIRNTFQEKIWNPAVADVTLLALGTCAPQVSLAVIDAIQNLGEPSAIGLGAGTLLGSTAFNIFPILAVCVVAPKNYEVKMIKEVGVYIVELIWSFWAYIWLFLILQVWSPNVISVAEAILTVVQFPILVLHVFVQEKHWKYVSIPWKQSPSSSSQYLESKELPPLTMRSYDPTAVDKEVFTADGSSDGFGDDVDLREDLIHAYLVTGQSSHSHVPGAMVTGSWKEVGSIWKQQFSDAMTVKGESGSDGAEKKPSILQLILHPLLSWWKICFAFIPPVAIFHGWLAFTCSVIFIAAISYTVIELANRFDCITGMSSYVLSMTVLAMGTSLPNLVASKIAAQEYPTADSAIANINASNCINVFVGLGIPWCIGAIYNSIKLGDEFSVTASGLGFLLLIYFVTFVLCISVVCARRQFIGGELGGPKLWAWASALFFLFLYAIFLLVACLTN